MADKLILKKNPKDLGYRSVMISMDCYDRATELKELTGLSYSAIFTSMFDFALEHVEIQED